MRRYSIITWILLAVIAAPAQAEVELTLNRSFIDKYRNRITIETDLIVDAAKKNPNSAASDGDLHVAGRPGPEIGLITVAEIQNAKDARDTVRLVNDIAGTGQKLHTVGVWRIWFEHANGASQSQGGSLSPAANSNPDHVFEIHPITRIGDHDLVATLRPIPGYTKPENTADRLRMVETMRATMTVTSTNVKLRVGGNNPNYIRFILKKLPGQHGYHRGGGEWAQPSDGLFMFAKLFSLDEELQVRKRRVGFVAGSEPFEKARDLPVNHCLDVLGVTRVNLELIAWRAANRDARPEVLGWNLPYELIAVGLHAEPWHCAMEEDE